MARRFIFSIAVMLAGLLPLSAQSSVEDEARAAINAATAKVGSLRCDFVQTKNMDMFDEALVSEGRLCYCGDGKLRWEYHTPYEYVFVLNGSSVLLKREGRSDVIDTSQSKSFREISRLMADSISGKHLDDENFDCSITDEGDEWIATLVPKNRNLRQAFSKLILHFRKTDVCVLKVELFEQSGDSTVIELKNIQINVSLDESLFAVD